MLSFMACTGTTDPVMVRTQDGYYGKMRPDEDGIIILPMSERDIIWEIYDRTGKVTRIAGMKPAMFHRPSALSRVVAVLRRTLSPRPRARARAVS